MNQTHIYFQINQTAKIRFDLSDQIKDAFRYDEVPIFLTQNNQNAYILFDDFLIVGLREFQWPLKQILASNLTLHSSITKDIGYLWNEYLHGVDLPYELNTEGTKIWVGQKLILFDSPELITTWLFEKNNKFWIEITPVYPWHHCDPKKGEKFISYEEFMRTYKPIALFEVSRETLEEWLKKVNEVLPIVEANDSKYFIKQK